MSEEEVALLLCEAYDRAKSVAWIDGGDDSPKTRHAPRVIERWLSVVRIARDRLEANKREQTAATILAALIQAEPHRSKLEKSLDDDQLVVIARSLTDALRAELAKGQP